MPTRIKNKNKREYMIETLKIIILSIFIFLIIITTVYTIRANNFEKTFPTTKAYYNYRLAKETTNQLTQVDEKIIPQREYSTELFYKLINTIKTYYPGITTFIPFILGIINIIILSLTLNEFFKLDNKKITKIQKKENTIILLIANLFFITSPIFIYQAFSFSPFLLNILLTTLTIFFLLKVSKTSQKKYAVLAILTGILLSITGSEKFIISITIFIGLYFFKKNQINNKILLLTIAISTIIHLGINYKIIFNISTLDLFKNYLIQNLYFIEIGAKTGIRLIDFILSILAIGILWSKKNKYYITSIILILLIGLSIKNPNINQLIYPIYAILCAFTIWVLIKREWELNHLKKLTLTLIITFYIIFSTQYLLNLSFSEPTVNQTEAFSWLNSETNNQGVVFSSIENGFLIQSFSNKITYIDENLDYLKEPEKKIIEYNQIINTRDINIVNNIINKYNINYFIIDEKMKKNFWNEKIDGLYFVLKNSEQFETIYSENSIEIFKVNQTQ